MGSLWRVLVEFALPPPLLLLALLLLPSPRPFRRRLLATVDRTLSLPVLGTLKLAAVAQAVTGAALVSSARDALRLSSVKHIDIATPSATAALLAKRWRAERNAWIATLAFLSWLALARVTLLVRRLASLEDAVAERARPAATAFLAGAQRARAGASEAPASPASAARMTRAGSGKKAS